MGVSKNRGGPPKMDGENNGNTLLKLMIWGVLFWKTTHTTQVSQCQICVHEIEVFYRGNAHVALTTLATLTSLATPTSRIFAK